MGKTIKNLDFMNHHHQPINVPTTGAQTFLMDYPQGERAITHHAGPVRIGCADFMNAGSYFVCNYYYQI
jgi:hypothetical protein